MIVWLADRRPRVAAEEPAKAAPPENTEKPGESTRDTFDQLVYAFLLLIVGRGFLLEPFVIPTGSMAPTLYGRHKECVCDSCGFNYQVGASSEVDGSGTYVIPGNRILVGTCPNCRKPNDIKESMAFSGDRVTVNKWAYTLGDPDRFDVFVFKFPEEAARNYIKRLVGLPGEKITIRGGDLYLHTDAGEQILRKEQPRKQRAMTQLVHDDRWHSVELAEAGWPARWNAWGEGADPTDSVGAKPATGDTEYTLESGQDLRYTHWIPTAADWTSLKAGGRPLPQAKLINDYCFYNAYTGQNDEGSRDICRSTADAGYAIATGNFWVPDIGFEGDIYLTGDTKSLTLELVEGIFRYRCRIDCSSGQAEMFTVNIAQNAAEERPLGSAATPLRAGGRHSIRFSNIDDELVLWVDESPVDFDGKSRYERTKLDSDLPSQADLSPIGISVEGGTATVSDLQVFRDVYYLADHGARFNPPRFWCELAGSLADPEAYARIYEGVDYEAKTLTIQCDKDGYLAFGDNSPRSNDSRLWTQVTSVPSSHLVGKAFWIYWPHPIPMLNGGRGFAISNYYETGVRGLRKIPNYPKYTAPFYPQFSRMTRIR